MIATFAELTGASLPPELDGISLVSTLTGRSIQAQHECPFREFSENGVSQAEVLDGRWMAIRPKEVTAPIQLYDLAYDIGDGIDAAKQNPALVARGAEIMRTAHAHNNTWKIPGLTASPSTASATTR